MIKSDRTDRSKVGSGQKPHPPKAYFGRCYDIAVAR